MQLDQEIGDEVPEGSRFSLAQFNKELPASPLLNAAHGSKTVQIFGGPPVESTPSSN